MNELVSIKDGEVRANSRDIAAVFDKAHRDVLRAIDKLIELAPEAQRNFAQGSFMDQRTGKQQHRMFHMDRDGFSLLAMGFTGPKALQWKLKFIEAFNQMEQSLRRSLAANDDQVELHPAVMSEGLRDAIRTAVTLARFVSERMGPAAGMAVLREYRVPLPACLDEIAAEPALPAAEEGPLYKWTTECAVRPNPGVATPAYTLWQEYAAWSRRNGYRPADPPKFNKGLRTVFGKEERRGLFNLEVGKTSFGDGSDLRSG